VTSVTVQGPWLGESTGMSPIPAAVGIPGRKSYHDGMRAKVSEKGQVTIPKRLRDSLGIEPGDVLDFDEESGRLVAVKQPKDVDWESLRGIRPHRFGPPEERILWLEESLREVEDEP
jgi:AbrB family looped-hinge helix DNA binding protein